MERGAIPTCRVAAPVPPQVRCGAPILPTHLDIQRGFVYLVAELEWYGRCLLAVVFGLFAHLPASQIIHYVL